MSLKIPLVSIVGVLSCNNIFTVFFTPIVPNAEKYSKFKIFLRSNNIVNNNNLAGGVRTNNQMKNIIEIVVLTTISLVLLRSYASILFILPHVDGDIFTSTTPCIVSSHCVASYHRGVSHISCCIFPYTCLCVHLLMLSFLSLFHVYKIVFLT